VYKISKEQLADYKELFILFDKDKNGVLSFAELGTAMKTLGQRLPGKKDNQYHIFLMSYIW
jgi:Ca2+-binding EF-hand superfamily protein